MSELQRILGKLAPPDFFRDFWERRPLHVAGPPDRFVGLYDVETWKTFEGVTDLKAATTDGAGVQVETGILPEQAGVLFMAGFTICANVSTEPNLAPFLDGFRRTLGLPVGAAFAKLYASNDGGGFSVHADKHHVFVLQLAGRKRWRYSRAPVVVAPMEGIFLDGEGRPCWTSGDRRQRARLDDGTLVEPPDAASFESVVLEPGHCLYLPPGTWHLANALGHSIAVSLSPERVTLGELLGRAVQELCAQNPEWRRDIFAPPDGASPAGTLPVAVERRLDAGLADLSAALARLDKRSLHRRWLRDVGAPELEEDAPAAPPDPTTIHRSDVFTRAGEPLHFIVAPSDDGREERCFFYRGAEWSLPGAARELLTKVGAQTEFRAETALAWDRRLKFEDVRNVLGTLVAAGVLTRAGHRATPSASP
jgi:Cupin superfamily protein